METRLLVKFGCTEVTVRVVEAALVVVVDDEEEIEAGRVCKGNVATPWG